MSTPVPPRPSGYRIGSGDAPLQIEAFLDLECPFCKKAWPTLLALVNQESGSRLAVTVQPTILSDHRQSWDLTKTLTAIAQQEPLKAWTFISHLYQRQQDFQGSAFNAKTRQDLFQLIERLVREFDAEVPIANMMADIKADDGSTASRTKPSIRYAITRGVWSTPTFFINGSEVPQLESSSTIGDWRDFLASLN
ncbi:MAG: thioredoxin domain-containing protein [Cyanobacteria bacterium P01_A01_bin.135]